MLRVTLALLLGLLCAAGAACSKRTNDPEPPDEAYLRTVRQPPLVDPTYEEATDAGSPDAN